MAKAPVSLIPTRRTLISKLKNWDDQKSWKEFFDIYGGLIYGVAIQARLTDTEAQEAVQETVICVAKKIKEFKYDPAIGSFKGWLLQITRWRIGDQFKKRPKHANIKPDANDDTRRTATIDRVPDPSAEAEIDAIFDREWEKKVLEIALEKVKAQVNPKHYQIFELYVLKQWPTAKVASTLGISMGKVFLVKHRVASKLKAEIRKIEKDGGV